jgi:hypothetical protein
MPTTLSASSLGRRRLLAAAAIGDPPVEDHLNVVLRGEHLDKRLMETEAITIDDEEKAAKPLIHRPLGPATPSRSGLYQRRRPRRAI